MQRELDREKLSSAKQALLERMRRRTAPGLEPPLHPRTQRDRVPLSFAQQRMWLIQQLNPHSHLYTYPRALELRGRLDLGALERALDSILRRHEVLRTAFPADDEGKPWQNILPELTIPVGVTELTRTPRARRRLEVERLTLEFAYQPFDLARAPLLRAHVFRLGADEHVLAVAMHHIIGDGWASAVFFRELGEFYKAHISGEKPAVADLTVQYADYAIWQRDWMGGATLEKEIEFWRKQLAGAPLLLDLPADRARREESDGEGGSCSFSIGEELTSRLQGLCRSQGTTLFPVMLAGLNVLLARWSGQHDQVLGTITANRDRAEIENLIGCFMNFLPLRAVVNPDESVFNFVQRTKRSVFESLAHQSCPFEKIVEAIQPERSLNLNPLYNVMLLVQNFPEIAFPTEDLRACLLPLEHGLAVVDLRFVVEERDGQLSITCEYDKSLLEGKTVDLLLASYEAVLGQMVRTPEARVGELKISEALVQQASGVRKRAQKQVVAVASTFTAEPIAGPLAFWMKELGIAAGIEFAPYNQVMQQLLDPSSLLSRNSHGINILLVRLTDWTRYETAANAEAAQATIESRVRELTETVKKTAQRSGTDLLLCLCPESKFLQDPNSNQFLERMEQLLRAELDSMARVDLITPGQILGLYPVDKYEDEYADKLGHIPYTEEFFIALATVLARRIFLSHSPEPRVMVLDCDTVLGKVTAGDDADGQRAGRRAIQDFALEQSERGMLLCLYSRRAEDEVARGFAVDPEMPLHREHIVAERLGESSARSALRELAEEIQLDLDSFVFLTDDRETYLEVEAQCREARAILLPDHAAKIPEFLRHVWVFDAAEKSHPRPRGPHDSRTLNRIASELSDVASIRSAMEASGLKRRSEARTLTLPRSPIEEMLSDIWAQLLKLDRVGIDDNFFALGGHSLLATQVMTRVRRITGIELGLRAIFETPTVAGLAKQIEAGRQSADRTGVPPLTRSGKRDHLPLSFAQQRLWFLDQLEPGNPIYNLAQTFRMRGQLDPGALKRALDKIVARHQSLRTTFPVEAGEPIQVVRDELDLPLPITDLSGLGRERRESQAEKLSLEEAQRPFRLSSGPLIRAQLVRLDQEDHVLVLTMHHIISDRWSMGLVGEELASFYRAFVAGEAPAMPELPIQYPDFSLWQRQWLSGELLGKQLGYWTEQLAGAPAILELPTDRPRPPVMSLGGATQSTILPRELVDRLTRLSRTEGVTLFMTLLAAFDTLLARYSGQDDLVVGSPIAGRHFSEIEPLIGFFVNTLALRGNLSGDPTFRELLLRTREICLQAYAHQDLPFEKLVEELQPERSLAHSPIFQVMFALQNVPLEALKMPGLEVERRPIYTSTSMFDMSWFAVEHPDGLMIRAEYSTDLFDDRTITRALAHFENLLEAGVAHPDRRISQLGILSEEERHQVLVEFNRTAAEFPRLCIHHLLEQTAERLPENVALICGEERISYRELNTRANQIAHYLMKLGAGPDVLVGVHMERTRDLVPAIFGVLKSGSAYVPLDPSYPRERLASILEDSRAGIIVTQRSLLGQLQKEGVQFVAIDAEQDLLARESAGNPATAVQPDNLAYVLFTSGSTGRPKGVALEHHNNVTFVEWAQTVFTPQELAGVLCATSIGFDMSTFEMFITAAAGGKIILAENPLYLAALAAKEEVTVINTVPSVMAELVRMNALPPSLTTVALAGEALPESLVEEIYRSGAVKKVYNLYGPTESGYSTWTLVPRGGRVTIGQPIANEQCYILDKARNPQPIGVPGELYLAGEGLARGYFGRTDLTEERFLPNPFRAQKDARMYKTGDLCRWLPDGTIEYIGRIDHQVKLRGFRVELGEIETVLARHASVRQCLVMAREDQPGMQRLVAYLVLEDGAEAQDEALAAHLKQHLPNYMIPAAFVYLEAFPLTPNRKIDRKALTAPEYKKDSGENYIAPRNTVEEKIAAIWAEVLDRKQVSADAGFFALGGHSLSAAQVMSRLRQSFGVELPLKTIFESPVLEVLAARIQAAKPGFEVPPITLVSRERPIPASFAQQRVWFLDQLEPDNATFNIAYTMKISGEIDVDAIEKSLNLIVARHESLRTSFRTVGDDPVQVIHGALPLPFRRIDLSPLDLNASEAEARRLIAEDANRAFDLSQAPLARATYFKLSQHEHYLLINIHHIISDRWSIGVLTQELSAAYAAVIEGKAPELPPLPLQYADYSVWQREWLRGEALERQLQYWKDKLKDAPPVLELPTDRPRQATESFRGDVAYVTLPSTLRDKLNRLSRNHGTTMFMTLLAGFQVLLSRHSGQDDIVVGTAIANRTHPDLEKVIGFFLNTLPLRTRLNDDPSFAEILARAKDTALGAYAHQDMPFEKLVEELKPERSLSHSPLVQVFFVLQNAPTESFEMKGLALKHVPSGTKTVKGDMYLSMHESQNGIEGRLEYSTDLFDAATMERLLGHFQTLLEAAADNPELKLSELPLLTQAERQTILADWAATYFKYPRDACLHQLFELQATRTPDAVACLLPGDTPERDQYLTYSELNRRANQLAHALKKRGAGPGKRIGIFIERSIEMMVGLLGIQKSGAAYVPLDPAYPAERIRLTLEDAQVALILTEESLLPYLPEHKGKVLCLDLAEIHEESVSNLGKTAGPEDIVYVIFTSGSTGRPKGVEVPHRAVVNLLHFMGRELGVGPDDVFPALASFAFDMCIPELYLALVTGGRVVIGGKDLAANGEELSALLERTGSTIVHATPTTWRLLLEAGFSGKGRKRAIGAETLPQELCRRLLSEDGSLYNFYGPTETTVWSTWHHFTSPDEPVVVGRPISNTQVYILDRRMQPVPAGVYGEIYIAGDGVSHGYLNRPELTAEKFVNNPFASQANRKMYHTGDVGRYLADGRIEFQGRADDQVKVRGYRIELGEVETVVGRHPAVNENVVVAREDVAGDKRLVAYFVARPEQRVDAAELRSWVRVRLPEYMVPVAWVQMEKLPLSSNGKVDRKQLPMPQYSRPELRAEYSRPRTPEEEIIAGIWSEVLKVEHIGTEDDFFELGGHSLLATQVVSRLRQAFQVELPLRDLFEARTVAGLAERITWLGKKRAGIETAPLGRAGRQGPIPLSFAQRRLWFLDQLEPGNPLYNVASVARVEGELNYEALEKSLNEIARRHESLRTTFPNLDGEPAQAIAPEVEIRLQILDCSHLGDLTACENEARRLASAEIQKPFDLATGPLLRALAVRMGDRDHALIVNMHHIISDRWSLAVLTQELGALYQANLAGKPSPLPELEIQYADYAVWQRQFLSGDVLDRQLRYWHQKLEGAPPVLEIPTDRPRERSEQFWGAHHIQPLPDEITEPLKTISRNQRGTFYTSLLAGFELLMARLAEQDDVVIGTDLANRNQIETEKLIGFFVNLLPIRARVDRRAAFADFYQQIRETVLETMTHQDIPFDKLVEELRPERSLSHNPLVQILFVMQNTPPLVREFGGLKLRPLGVSSTSRFDLVVFINNPESDVSVTWMYNPTRFDPDRVRQMANSYEFVLQTIGRDPGVKLESLFAALDEFERAERRSEQEKVQRLGLEKLKKVRRKAIAEV